MTYPEYIAVVQGPGDLRDVNADECIAMKWQRNAMDHHEDMKRMQVDIGAQCMPARLISYCKSNIKWMEWALCGKSIIANNMGQYHEDIQHGVNGLLYYNKEHFAETIQELLKFKYDTVKMAQNALIDILDKYTMEKQFEEYDFFTKAKRIIFYGYDCPWRLWEVIDYAKHLGIETRYIPNGDWASWGQDILNKDTVVYTCKTPVSDYDFLCRARKRLGTIIYDIDDLTFNPGTEYFVEDQYHFLKNAWNVVDYILVSTKTLKPLVENMVQWKCPVLLRENAILLPKWKDEIARIYPGIKI
jgi:hypothetical protein